MTPDATELADLLRRLAPRMPNGDRHFVVSLTAQEIEMLRGLVQQETEQPNALLVQGKP